MAERINTSLGIINIKDTNNAIRAMVDGIGKIANAPQNKPFDPVQFLTDSKKVLQRVNAVVKVIGTIVNISSVFGVPLDAGRLIALIPEVHRCTPVIVVLLLSAQKLKTLKLLQKDEVMDGIVKLQASVNNGFNRVESTLKNLPDTMTAKNILRAFYEVCIYSTMSIYFFWWIISYLPYV
jgi:hypothetical protein